MLVRPRSAPARTSTHPSRRNQCARSLTEISGAESGLIPGLDPVVGGQSNRCNGSAIAADLKFVYARRRAYVSGGAAGNGCEKDKMAASRSSRACARRDTARNREHSHSDNPKHSLSHRIHPALTCLQSDGLRPYTNLIVESSQNTSPQVWLTGDGCWRGSTGRRGNRRHR